MLSPMPRGYHGFYAVYGWVRINRISLIHGHHFDGPKQTVLLTGLASSPNRFSDQWAYRYAAKKCNVIVVKWNVVIVVKWNVVVVVKWKSKAESVLSTQRPPNVHSK